MPVITSPEWSGSEAGGRRYTAFTLNTEHLKPRHTLTGRQHFFLDHDWMHELGEALPVYRPPLDMSRLFGEPQLGPDGHREVTVRYLTPHNKWSIHSEYQDNLFMLALSRGGQTIWMSTRDADAIGCPTTTGSRPSTATAWSWPARSSRTACRPARSTCTTRRNARSTCRSRRRPANAAASTTRSPA